MILCKVNGKRYYGESSDISVRLAKHRYELKNGIQGNQFLQSDWTLYGKDSFEFQIIQMPELRSGCPRRGVGEEWGTKESRIEVESTLIKGDRARCYNTYAVISERTGLANSFWGKNHTPESKKKMSDSSKGIPNKLLGSRIEINGVRYASYSEASRLLNIDRKTIEKRVKSTTDRFSGWKVISNADWKEKGEG